MTSECSVSFVWRFVLFVCFVDFLFVSFFFELFTFL